jgi:hypothetical protein
MYNSTHATQRTPSTSTHPHPLLFHFRLQVCAVKAPGFGENRKNGLQDIAVLTGGEVGPPVVVLALAVALLLLLLLLLLLPLPLPLLLAAWLVPVQAALFWCPPPPRPPPTPTHSTHTHTHTCRSSRRTLATSWTRWS